jgi:hypothetical protein
VVADDTKADKVGDAGMTVEMPLLLPFSLTKHFAIFAEVKVCLKTSINLKDLLGMVAEATCLAPVKRDSTIN